MSEMRLLKRGLIPGLLWLVMTSVATLASAQDTSVASESVEEHLGFDIEFGALAVERTMTLRVDASAIAHNPQPYLGAYFRSGLDLARFEELDASLRVEGEFTYGVARNTTVSSNLGREAVTQMSAGGARLGISRQLSEEFDVFVGLGSHVTSFVIEANPEYTGHRYITGEAALSVEWLGTSSPISAGVELAALPVLSMNQSSGGYGQGRGFGARAQAEAGWNFLERDVDSGYSGGRLSLRYRYQRFRTLFPERRVSLEDGVSIDQQHALLVTFGYFL